MLKKYRKLVLFSTLSFLFSVFTAAVFLIFIEGVDPAYPGFYLSAAVDIKVALYIFLMSAGLFVLYGMTTLLSSFGRSWNIRLCFFSNLTVLFSSGYLFSRLFWPCFLRETENEMACNYQFVAREFFFGSTIVLVILFTIQLVYFFNKKSVK